MGQRHSGMKILAYLVKEDNYGWDDDEITYEIKMREPEYGEYVPVTIETLGKGGLKELFEGR